MPLGLKADNGVAILIHVGLETVGLGGAPFKAHISQGDHFKKGQLLLEFDMDQIKAAGLPNITPVIVTNEDEVGDVVIEDGKIVIGA
jgi:phosphotransferase system IIA component